MKFKIAVIAIFLVPFLALAQDSGKKKAYFFYLDTCPHCHNVDDYFTQNGIYDNYDIKKLDASAGQNGDFLMKLYEANNFPEDQRGGVPVVAFSDKFFVGDKPVIDNFVKEIEASQDADELPSSVIDGKKLNLVVHEGSISSSNAQEEISGSPNQENPANGNKKSYLPVIIGVLVILGAGVLIFTSRN